MTEKSFVSISNNNEKSGIQAEDILGNAKAGISEGDLGCMSDTKPEIVSAVTAGELPAQIQECLKVLGPAKLNGSVKISGAKNSALPILAATVLTESAVLLENIPNLQDVSNMLGLLVDLGGKLKFCDNNQIGLDNKDIKRFVVPFELVKKMRASVLVLGPLLARFGKAIIALPGGCAIGSRPIDIHLEGLAKMGAVLTESTGYVYAHVNGRLKGAHINCHTVSVTATEHLMMAASLADGVTRISNAACEPEVIDVGNFLIAMGAKIQGLGEKVIEIEGVKSLDMPVVKHKVKAIKSCEKKTKSSGKKIEEARYIYRPKIYSVIPDRIEAGTYLVAAALTGGFVHLKGVCPQHLGAVMSALKQAGVDNLQIKNNNEIICDARGVKLKAVNIDTAVYPGFPTDMQAQFMSLNLIANGGSRIIENIFENRFMHAQELSQLGAKISIDGNLATISGGSCLMGAPVKATDLRASAALVLAALGACGETVIHNIYHMDRGYCQMELKLRQLGVKVKREVLPNS